MNNSDYHNPYAEGDGIEVFDSFEMPVLDMDVDPTMEAPEQAPVVESNETSIEASTPLPVREAEELRIVADIGEIRTVVRTNGKAGIPALRDASVPDDTATIVYLREEDVALVFDHQSEQWGEVSSVLAMSPGRVEATGRIRPAKSVPFDVADARSCMVDPGVVRFYRMNSLGMEDSLVDLVVEHGEISQHDHREPSGSAIRDDRSRREAPAKRAAELAAARQRAQKTARKNNRSRKGATGMRLIGTIGSTIATMGRGIGRGVSAPFSRNRDVQAEVWEERAISDCRNITELAGEIALERSRMTGENAPRLDVVELDHALAFLQHSAIKLVRDIADSPDHPLQRVALDCVWAITDRVAEAQDTAAYPTRLRSRLSTLEWLGVRAAAYAESAEITKIGGQIDSSEMVEQVLDIALSGGSPVERAESVDAGVTNQVGLSG